MVDVALETVTPQLIAAARAKVRVPEIKQAWEPALYKVKAYLGDHPELAASGRHVFLYHHPTQRDQPMDIDFGIEVARSFTPDGDIQCVATPEGQVAVALHHGSLTTLPQTHMAVHQWCAANGHAIGEFSWETYTWGGAPDPLETVVRYLLRS